MNVNSSGWDGRGAHGYSRRNVENVTRRENKREREKERTRARSSEHRRRSVFFSRASRFLSLAVSSPRAAKREFDRGLPFSSKGRRLTSTRCIRRRLSLSLSRGMPPTLWHKATPLPTGPFLSPSFPLPLAPTVDVINARRSVNWLSIVYHVL